MSDDRIECAVEQLVRYGGQPDARVLMLLDLLTDLNDDLWHSRNLSSVLTKVRDQLDQIERSPDLILA